MQMHMRMHCLETGDVADRRCRGAAAATMTRKEEGGHEDMRHGRLRFPVQRRGQEERDPIKLEMTPDSIGLWAVQGPPEAGTCNFSGLINLG